MGRVETKFKETEIGLVPEDWQDLTFEQICWVNQGLQIPISSRFALPNKASKLYITIQYLNDGKEAEYIDDYNDSVCCNKEDILMTRTGNTGIVVSGVEGVFHNNFFKINFDKRGIDKDFLIYYLTQPKTKKIILAQAGVSTIPDLNHRDFYSIPIPIPPTKTEQTAIANALSDVDGYIESIEKLIAKKEKIKQGAMQQLFKPKKDWRLIRVEKIGNTFGGISGKSKSDFINGNSPYIPFMNVMKNVVIDTNFISYVKIGTKENQNKVLKGDLFFNGSSETPDELGMCSVLTKNISNLYLNSFCFGFRLSQDCKENNLYLSYFFRSDEGRKIFYSMAQGATRYNLSKEAFKKIEILVPDPTSQQQIAQILTDMDSEITTLTKKLTKAKDLKQGMMQQLLTGKIRLI